jgi:hypothetical protein
MKYLFIIITLAVGITISGAFGMEKGITDLILLLPEEVDGWKASQKDGLYGRDNLYDYINGGAELYLSFGFKRVINRTYERPKQPDIVVDLFDMGTSKNAYGVFSHSMETVETTYGQGSQYSEGLLLFWKDRYYLSVMSYPETPESQKALFILGEKIETAIKGEGPLPDILDLLPQDFLIPESIRYFRHYAWLNSHYFIADTNILQINDSTDGVLAKYRADEKKFLLLLVEYKNSNDARAAHDSFVKHYLPELTQKKTVRIEDGTWTACQLQEDLIIIVLNAPEENKARHLIEYVKNKRLQKQGGNHGG